jgi:hypothetical protein
MLEAVFSKRSNPKLYTDHEGGLGLIHIDVVLLLETNHTPHERLFIPNYYFYRTDCLPGRKGETAVAVRKAFPTTM